MRWEAYRKWHEANPEKAREASRKWNEAHPGKVREAYRKWREANPRWRNPVVLFLHNLKAHIGCQQCGEGNPIVLDFDHIDPSAKITETSRMVLSPRRNPSRTKKMPSSLLSLPPVENHSG